MVTPVLSVLSASPDDDRDYIYSPKGEFPKIVQWRKLLGDIEDQLSIGSCTANSVVSACELILASNSKKRNLSRLFNYFVTRQLENRLGQEGAVLRNALKQASKLGLPDEEIWEYSLLNTNINPPISVYTQAMDHKLTRYERVVGDTTQQIIDGIKSAISEGYPVVFATPVSNQWLQMYGADLTYRGTKADPKVGNHAMCIIGYSQDYFVIENSWGKEWGDQGIGYMACELASEFFEVWVVKGFDGVVPLPFVSPVQPQPQPQPLPPTPTPIAPVKPVVNQDSRIKVGIALILSAVIYFVMKFNGLV